MADISRITLPSGNTYDIKDAVARQMISGGVSFIIAWDGASTPVPADIANIIHRTLTNVGSTPRYSAIPPHTPKIFLSLLL